MNNSQELVHAKLPRFDRRDGTVQAHLQYNVRLFPVPERCKEEEAMLQGVSAAAVQLR